LIFHENRKLDFSLFDFQGEDRVIIFVRFELEYKFINLKVCRQLEQLYRFFVLFCPFKDGVLQWWRIRAFKLARGFSLVGRDQIAAHLLELNQIVASNLRIIDVGAGDPYWDNNTVLFQTVGDAEITSVDVHERLISLYTLKRTGKYIHACIGLEEDQFSIQTTWSTDNHDEREITEIDVILGIGKRPSQDGRDTVPVKPLDKLVEPGKFDLLFLRNHGYEELALEGIDFDKFEFRYVFVENNTAFRSKSVIREFMEQQGYELCGRIIGFDDVFRRSNKY
jgi:hypothetical protein